MRLPTGLCDQRWKAQLRHIWLVHVNDIMDGHTVMRRDLVRTSFYSTFFTPFTYLPNFLLRLSVCFYFPFVSFLCACACPMCFCIKSCAGLVFSEREFLYVSVTSPKSSISRLQLQITASQQSMTSRHHLRLFTFQSPPRPYYTFSDLISTYQPPSTFPAATIRFVPSSWSH